MKDRENKYYAVTGCADGSHEGYVVYGLEAAKWKLMKMFFDGPFHEALKDPIVEGLLKEFYDVENNWCEDGRVFHQDLEQAWIRVEAIDEICFYHDRDRVSQEQLDDIGDDVSLELEQI